MIKEQPRNLKEAFESLGKQDSHRGHYFNGIALEKAKAEKEAHGEIESENII